MFKDLSTSLPEHVQRQLIASVPGLENAEMMRAGYAIEYDAIVPTQLWPTLETKKISNLYTAGQLMEHLVMKKQLAKDLWLVLMQLHVFLGKKSLF